MIWILYIGVFVCWEETWGEGIAKDVRVQSVSNRIWIWDGVLSNQTVYTECTIREDAWMFWWRGLLPFPPNG